MTKLEEIKVIRVICAFLLWCGFLLIFTSTGDFAGVVQGLSGFLLTIGAVGAFIMSLIEESDNENAHDVDMVEVPREELSSLAEYALLLDALEECGVRKWEMYPVAEALHQDKLKKIKEVLENDE